MTSDVWYDCHCRLLTIQKDKRFNCLIVYFDGDVQLYVQSTRFHHHADLRDNHWSLRTFLALTWVLAWDIIANFFVDRQRVWPSFSAQKFRIPCTIREINFAFNITTSLIAWVVKLNTKVIPDSIFSELKRLSRKFAKNVIKRKLFATRNHKN